MKKPYFWDNKTRKDVSGFVIQRTIHGSVALWGKDGRVEAGEGQALLFRHGEDSRYGLDDACKNPYQHIWLIIAHSPVIRPIYDDLINSFGHVVRMNPKGEACQIMDRMYEARNVGAMRDRFSDAETVFALLLAIYREQVSDRRGRDPVAYGRHLLETQYRSPRNLKEWAEEIGLTREHFSREFRARYGETPATFLRSLRLENAKRLLLNPSLTVDEVSAASGFANPKTFHRAFKNAYGVPPGYSRT